MRSLEASRKRWDVLYSDDQIRLDLRQAVRDLEDAPSPCEDGLRSVCWKAFLLYGPLSQVSWPKKLSDSRSAYTSLREHFLKYINHPNDLQSTVDPLADDANSPWSALRQDEVSRGEIFQDVERCMQDNAFFQEPSTKNMLLDILFIYSKLHPDIGYRQGMHELLAPILWVVYCDAIESTTPTSKRAEDSLMTDVLDRKFIEHDAFTLFCAVMQTAKSFYEIGDSSSPIVERSRRIHEEYLAEIDPQLANHLRVIEILPQIFLLRWIRLLFGREFSLKDTLSVWDILFAEDLSLSLVDMTCLAMLLRIRWSLLRADHATALHLLLHYEPPPPPNGPATLVLDAIFLDRNRTFEGGASLVTRYSGLRIDVPEKHLQPARKPPVLRAHQNRRRNRSPASRRGVSPGRSPTRSPARFLSPQKGLETLFQDVSGNLQRRTEGWNVSKAVRAAAGEVRRNVNNLQSSATSSKNSISTTSTLSSQFSAWQDTATDLSRRLSAIEKRNKVLAKMLGHALEELLAQKQLPDPRSDEMAENHFNTALAKLQFVQVYLADPEIPIPGQDEILVGEIADSQPVSVETNDPGPALLPEGVLVVANPPVCNTPGGPSPSPVAVLSGDKSKEDVEGADKGNAPKEGIEHEKVKSTRLLSPQRRPALAKSHLSWMLGEGHHRSDFVSSSIPPPEQRRDSAPKIKPKRLFAEGKDDGARNECESGDDGFTMSSFDGSQSKE